MSDMLVKLYQLPETQVFGKLAAAAVEIRPAMAPEKRLVCSWIAEKFGEQWASEAEVAFARQPCSIVLAIANQQLLGFGCYDATCKGFFGPTGVDEKSRGQGIGEGLLFMCLQTMRAQGYGYAVIGGAGPKEFYRAKVGAVEIAGSVPGIYQGMLS
ncbi:GNAT family N-acetyltransferase ['Osedax' symbiont bacterium Rs2_46_30_T18]|nr:GNAT family N-acetyltransferase ['Osedax' symbiont bacterium Rs2_46_30_T18]